MVSPQVVADTLTVGDCVTFRVKGQCMFPLLTHDQEITVAKVDRYYPGDIIVFAGCKGEWLVHRYLGRLPFLSTPRFMTCADNGCVIDTIPVRSLVLGKVTAVEGNSLHISAATRMRCCAEFAYWVVRLVLQKIHRQWMRTSPAISVAGKPQSK